jgi:hypothetical protein
MENATVDKTNEAASFLRLSNRSSSARRRSRILGGFLLDTSLSSSAIPNNSTRHSVTSRIASNSRLFCYLIFSSRHLNATLVKDKNVEKFNTCLRLFFVPQRAGQSPIRASGVTHGMRFARTPGHEETEAHWGISGLPEPFDFKATIHARYGRIAGAIAQVVQLTGVVARLDFTTETSRPTGGLAGCRSLSI